MSTTSALHITPEGKSWAVKLDEAARPSSIHSTQGQAIASAWELAKDRDETEVVVYDQNGRIQARLTIHQVEADDSDDPAARAEALRLAPSNARLKAGIARRLAGQGPQIEGNFDDDEEMPY